MPPEENAPNPNAAASGSLPGGPPAPPNAPHNNWYFNIGGWGGVALALSVTIVLLLAVGSLYYFRGPTRSSPAVAVAETEARFHYDIPDADSTSQLAGEWRAARSDHKIVAYAIARCLGVEDIGTMPETMFSMLMLDLRPNGDHWWNHGADPGRAGPTTQVKKLDGYEAAMLAISDEVARARLAATGGAEDFFPYMLWFGWASVIVAAVATALVTLKASMSTETHPQWSNFFGILAVLFSTAATVLTGAKQFWDPTNAYMRNETALLALRQLHADISLTFIANWDASTCAPKAMDVERTSLSRWRGTLVSLQSGTMRAPVIVATQNSTATQSGGSGDVPPRPPGRDDAPPAEKASAESK
jgi:hypothetical protein